MSTELNDRLDQWGSRLAEQASASPPPELLDAVGRRGRAIWVKRVALAAMIAFVGLGAVVVYLAAPKVTRTPAPTIVNNGGTPTPVLPNEVGVPKVAAADAPASIAWLHAEWARTGEVDPPVASGHGDAPIRAGDIGNPERLEQAVGPWR